MKLSANLERIADQATGIARRARRLNQSPLIVQSQLIERMTSDVTGMLKDSLRAFTDGDLELAATIKPRDRLPRPDQRGDQPAVDRSRAKGAGPISRATST